VQQTALTVPDVTGQDKDDAKKALEAKGFEVDTNTVDGGGQKDSVLSTDPAAGTQAQPGSKVTMNVSKGNQQNQLPNVVGQTLASAAQNLAAAGYTNLAVQGSRDPNSIVTDQNPSDSDTNTDKRIVLTTQSSGGGTANNGFGLLN
jgi:serine/threonine-protein kinase